jgi:hypothetical protein
VVILSGRRAPRSLARAAGSAELIEYAIGCEAEWYPATPGQASGAPVRVGGRSNESGRPAV